MAQAAFETARLVSSHTPTALKLVSAYVALVQPSKVGPLMENLRTALPLKSLQHLKRVRKGPQQPMTEVLLCALKDLEQHQQNIHQQQPQDKQAQQQEQQQQQQQHPGAHLVQAAPQDAASVQMDHQQQQRLHEQHTYPHGLPPSTISVLAQLQAHVTVKEVPGCTPDNRQQWQTWAQLWPMPWRCPAGIAEQQDGEAPSTADQTYFEQHMAAVVAASSAAGGRNVARIVDPKTGTVLAEAVDASAHHPLDHAAMVAIEAVAARDRLLWPFNGFAHVGRHAEAPDANGYIAMQTQHPVCAWGQDEAAAEDTCWQQRQEQVVEQQQQAGLPPCKKHKVCSTSNGNSAAATQHALCDCSSSLHDGPLDAASAAGTSDGCTNGSSQAAAAAAANGRVDWSNKPYLCTGYDCFLAREPCIMCSMGMVHSRLARVVYCQPDPQHGALGGKLRLHAHRSLNHHYLVYQLPVKDPSHQ